MKLFEHPDFEQAIIHAAEYFRSSGIREAIIEKDYYVTEALRIGIHSQLFFHIVTVMSFRSIFQGPKN